jgi:hypothetical protein
MKYIKHSKYKNTGLIFELLVRQIAADTIAKKDSPAVQILKKYYNEKSTLGKEYKIYEFISKHKNLAFNKADMLLNTVLETSKKLDQNRLRTQKYQLIKELKESYNIEDLFTIKIQDYKTYAALYCLLEIHNTQELVDPQSIIDNKTTILEHLTTSTQNPEAVKDTLIEEYSKYDKDLKLLTYKILLEKFNKRYNVLLPEQKNILKEFIISVNSSKKLHTLVNNELAEIKKIVGTLKNKIDDSITAIKLEEIIKGITPLTATEKVTDAHLISLMQYYDLLSELKKL